MIKVNMPRRPPAQMARDILDGLTTNDKGLKVKKAEAYAMLALASAVEKLADRK